MRISILTFTFFVSTILHAQKDQAMVINYQFFCAGAGVTSMSIKDCRLLVNTRNYSLIRTRLFSENNEDAILSAIVLAELQHQRIVELSRDEQAKIKDLKSLSNRYSICFTCTQHFEGKVKQLLTRKNDAARALLKFAVFETE